MATVGAKYVITADDKTRSAIESVRRGIKNLERDVGTSARAINTAFSLFAGAGIVQGMRKVFSETAKSNKEFAASLQEVKDAAAGLLVMNSGLPGLNEEMRKLAETLRDPAVQDGMDALLGTMAKFGTTVVRGWALLGGEVSRVVDEWRHADDPVNVLWRQNLKLNEALQEQYDIMVKLRGAGRTGTLEFISAERNYQSLQKQVAAKQAQMQALPGPLQVLPQITVTAPDLEARKAAIEALREAQQLQFDDYIRGVKIQIDLTNELEAAIADTSKEISASADDSIRAWADSVEESVAGSKQALGELSVFSDEAFRSIQSSIAAFMFDPFAEGLDGMLRGFVDTLRKMAAEAAAASFLNMLTGIAGNPLGALFGGIGKLFGFADGGQFKVGGSGGTDSQLVAFKASPNETVSITKPGQGRGGAAPVFNIAYNIDARGATTDFVKALPAILKQTSEATEARVVERIKRGYYGPL